MNLKATKSIEILRENKNISIKMENSTTDYKSNN